MDWTICTTLCLQSASLHHVCCSYHIWVPPTPRGDYTELVSASPQSKVTLTMLDHQIRGLVLIITPMCPASSLCFFRQLI